MHRFPLYVIYTEECIHSESNYGHEGQYTGSSHDVYRFTVEDVETTKPKTCYYEEKVLKQDSEVLPSKVYVVCVHYSTGSTFGRQDGRGYIEGVYATRDEADAVVDLINNGNYKGYNPWNGYFNNLEDVTIHKRAL